jgi:hypothetical protein
MKSKFSAMSFRSGRAYAFATACALLGTVGVANADGFTVTLEEVGSNVVATGNGALNVTGLTFFGTSISDSQISPFHSDIELGAATSITGPFNVDAYGPVPMTGPNSFGSSVGAVASSGTGLQVGIGVGGNVSLADIQVPVGYVSDTFLSSSATFDNQSFASLGVTPGSFTWTWGGGVLPDQSFTLDIVSSVPGPIAGAGLPGLIFAGGGLLAWWRRRQKIA